jgi:hypothetical protein
VILRRDAGYFLVCPESRAQVPKIALFREWITGAIRGVDVDAPVGGPPHGGEQTHAAGGAAASPSPQSR